MPCAVCTPEAQYAFRLGLTEMLLDTERRRADRLALILFAREIGLVAKFVAVRDIAVGVKDRFLATIRHAGEGPDAQN